MENFIEVKHPVLKHKLAMLRNKNTDSIGFRGLMNEIGKFLAYEITRDLEMEEFELETPMMKTKWCRAQSPQVVLFLH